ncbi:Hint domain-containing protein [Acidisoma sp. 7E03]
MSGTTLNLSLTAARLAEWEQSDVNVYAVLFSGSGAGTVTTLISSGAVTAAGSAISSGTLTGGEAYTIPLTTGSETLNGGKLYIIAQSGTQDISSLITSQSFINPGSATSYDFAYDSMEVSLLNKSTDAANLTSVNGFALPMELSDAYGSVGYKVSADTLVNTLTTTIGSSIVNTYTTGGLSGETRTVTSPTDVNEPGPVTTTGPYPQADWGPYLTALESIAPQVTITGQFNGAADATGIWHNAGYYAYSLSFDGTNFWLSPMSSSEIQGYILLTPADIEQNIYSQIGSVSIYTAASTSSTLIDTVAVGANDQWGAVLAQFLTGFTGGYYGQAGLSPNSQIGSTVSLDQNNNWDPSYAFHVNTETVVSPGNGVPYDQYSKVFFQDSNSYGSPYSDALMSQYTAGGPLLSVANSESVDVSTLDLTIFGSSETPTGYVTPTINDYIAPSEATVVTAGTIYTYALPTANTAGANVTLSFYSQVGADAGIDLDPTTAIAISYLTGETVDPTTGAVTPVWNTVTINGAGTYVVGNDSIAAPTLWNQWTIAPGSTIATLDTTTPNAPGSLVLNLPTADQGVSWYQITVGAGTADAKTYNFYTTTAEVPAGTDVNGQTIANAESGVFVNPAYTGQSASQAVDGLAGIAGSSTQSGPTQYTNTLTVSFAKGSTITYNPGLVVKNTGENANFGGVGYPSPAPTPVVADYMNDGTLTTVPGETGGAAGSQGNPITTPETNFQLGWAGYDTNSVTVEYNANVVNNTTTTQTTVDGYGWTGSAAVQPPQLGENEAITGLATITGTGAYADIGAYTNKVDGWGDAVILIDNGVGQTTTVITPADVDGNWLSNALAFGNGTYTITMFGAIEQNGTLAQTTQASTPLYLEVDSPQQVNAPNTVTLACFAEGTGIETAAGRVAVERLAVGDRLRTVSGAWRPIRWIGHRTVDCARHPAPDAVRPVRIRAGAFGAGLPVRDLDLSPDHAIFAEGVLVPIKHLVDGGAIRQRRVRSVTYYHVELDSHDVILAEGLPVETYLDTGDRAAFANGGDVLSFHPAWGSEARDVSLLFEAEGYAPLRVTGPEIARIRARLAATSNRQEAPAA